MTDREKRLSAALKLCEPLLPQESLYGGEKWDLIWRALKEADAILDNAQEAS